MILYNLKKEIKKKKVKKIYLTIITSLIVFLPSNTFFSMHHCIFLSISLMYILYCY